MLSILGVMKNNTVMIPSMRFILFLGMLRVGERGERYHALWG